MNVLVTGGAGFLGRRCLKLLRDAGAASTSFDRPASILDHATVATVAGGHDWCLHLAADKHAPHGENHPAEVAETNILGTRNIVALFGQNVVLASTCKAADPMTCYGASKLIAERIVLNAGGRVVRLVNVWGSTGSVAETWERIPADQPIPVTDCARLWMRPDEAAGLLVDALTWPSGRYAPNRGSASWMNDTAAVTHPRRERVTIPPRRGDRPVERLIAEYETARPWRDGVIRIEHPADLPAATAASLRAA
jgi:UDP-N-acetylglucosamine 4,6-dehydratase